MWRRIRRSLYANFWLNSGQRCQKKTNGSCDFWTDGLMPRHHMSSPVMAGWANNLVHIFISLHFWVKCTTLLISAFDFCWSSPLAALLEWVYTSLVLASCINDALAGGCRAFMLWWIAVPGQKAVSSFTSHSCKEAGTLLTWIVPQRLLMALPLLSYSSNEVSAIVELKCIKGKWDQIFSYSPRMT